MGLFWWYQFVGDDCEWFCNGLKKKLNIIPDWSVGIVVSFFFFFFFAVGLLVCVEAFLLVGEFQDLVIVDSAFCKQWYIIFFSVEYLFNKISFNIATSNDASCAVLITSSPTSSTGSLIPPYTVCSPFFGKKFFVIVFTHK